MRNAFVFYKSFLDAMESLPAESVKTLILALGHYAMDDVDPELSGIEKSMFTLIKPQIDANNRKFESGKLGGQYGSRGGRPKQNPTQTPDKPQDNPNQTPNANVNANVNVNDNVNANVNDNDNVKEKENVQDTPFVPVVQYEFKTNAATRLEGLRQYWNAKDGLPVYRHIATSMPPEQTGPALRTLGAYTDDEIQKAIDNYHSMLFGSDAHKYKVFPVYAGFPGFIRAGPESYGDDAKPFVRCRHLSRDDEEQERIDRISREARDKVYGIAN